MFDQLTPCRSCGTAEIRDGDGQCGTCGTINDTAADWTGLARYLRSSDADDVLDDAVLGCLPVSTVAEILADYGIAHTIDAARRFARMLDDAIGEGF
ncbi:MAG: hypothetical protein R3C15_19725 [Thermoleophilia bacterium]